MSNTFRRATIKTRPRSPQYADVSGEAIVNEEHLYIGQLVDPAELHSLRTSLLL